MNTNLGTSVSEKRRLMVVARGFELGGSPQAMGFLAQFTPPQGFFNLPRVRGDGNAFGRGNGFLCRCRGFSKTIANGKWQIENVVRWPKMRALKSPKQMLSPLAREEEIG